MKWTISRIPPWTFPCRSLSCQRITLHKNLFVSFVLNSIITVVWLTKVAKKQGHTYNDSVSELLSVQKEAMESLSCSYCPADRRAASCSCSFISTYWVATTSGCCVRASTCTLWLWWPCLPRSSISCGIICLAGVSVECKDLAQALCGHVTRVFDPTGFPLVPAVLHSIARQCYYNDKWVF